MNKKELSARLDTLVSVSTRCRGCFCVTCGKRLVWARRQAGHYIPRAVRATRWDRRNVNVQCAKCNVELGGNLEKYCRYMIKTYGEDAVMELEKKLAAYNQGKLKPPTYEEMVILYNYYLDEVGYFEAERGKRLVPEEWVKIE